MYKLICVDYLLDGKPYYAHTDKKGNRDEELLIDHMNLTIKYFTLYYDRKGLEPIIRSLIKKSGFSENESSIILDMFVNAIYLHDIGKINPDFQRNKMGNKQLESLGLSTVHSIYSSYIYISEVLKAYPEIKRRCFMAMISFAYVISCHHGRLSSPRDFEDNLKTCSDNGFYDFDIELINNSKNIGLGSLKMKNLFDDSEAIAFFILLRLLFTLITASDFCATTEYMNQTEHEISIIEDIDNFSSKYYESGLLKSIRNYTRVNDISRIISINDLRTEIFLEAEKSVMDNQNARIFYLEAPTGSGKTNTSINLALKLLKKDRTLNNIFYIFPFNTLVEQTADTLTDYFSDRDMAIVNSVTPLKNTGIESLDEETDYDSLWLNRLFNNYPLVVTTHVNFFNALLDNKEQAFSLIKLCNSAVIMMRFQVIKIRFGLRLLLYKSMQNY